MERDPQTSTGNINLGVPGKVGEGSRKGAAEGKGPSPLYKKGFSFLLWGKKEGTAKVFLQQGQGSKSKTIPVRREGGTLGARQENLSLKPPHIFNTTKAPSFGEIRGGQLLPRRR